MPLLRMLGAFSVIGALALSGAAAQEPTKVRFTLDWKYQGIHAYVFWAQEKGYFKAEGLDVDIDQGTGSSATVTRIASGTYDAGFGDMNAIIQLAGTKPGEQPVMVYMIYNKPPFALITKASSPIKTLKDVVGHTMGTPAGGSAGQLFAPLAKLNGHRREQGANHEHAAEPAGADAAQRAGRLFGGVHGDELHQPHRHEGRPRQGYPLAILFRLRRRSLLERHHGVAEAPEGE